MSTIRSIKSDDQKTFNLNAFIWDAEARTLSVAASSLFDDRYLCDSSFIISGRLHSIIFQYAFSTGASSTLQSSPRSALSHIYKPNKLAPEQYRDIVVFVEVCSWK